MRTIIPYLIAITLLINSPFTLLFAVSDDAFIVSYQGDVKIIRAGTNVGIKCSENMSVREGDLINTGSDSSVIVGHVGETTYMSTIAENSLVEILSGDPVWLDISNGKVLTRLHSVSEGSEFKIRTPVGVCGARGTGWEMTTDGASDTVKVFESQVYYYGLDAYGDLMSKGVTIKEGYKRIINKYETPGKMEVLETGELFGLWKTAGIMEEKRRSNETMEEGIEERGKVGVNKRG